MPTAAGFFIDWFSKKIIPKPVSNNGVNSTEWEGHSLKRSSLNLGILPPKSPLSGDFDIVVFYMTEVVSISPHAIAQWLPCMKAAGFFFSALVLEDVATIGAGLLLATGDITWPAAFTACFFGIWMGDTSLYGLARVGGRKWFEKSSFARLAPKVTCSERWFGKRGTPILIFTRMVPGARLPTYLAAGFLRVPLRRFLLVTGVASFVWTTIVLFAVKTFGERVVHWLHTYKYGGLFLAAAAIVVYAVMRYIRTLVLRCDSRKVRCETNCQKTDNLNS
jgi:membrane protein DedA with SNARE-associated domain